MNRKMQISTMTGMSTLTVRDTAYLGQLHRVLRSNEVKVG